MSYSTSFTTARRAEPMPGLTDDEIEALQVTDLPVRDALSLVNLNAAVPINAAIAANVLSDSSTAAALATQSTPITQTT